MAATATRMDSGRIAGEYVERGLAGAWLTREQTERIVGAWERESRVSGRGRVGCSGSAYAADGRHIGGWSAVISPVNGCALFHFETAEIAQAAHVAAVRSELQRRVNGLFFAAGVSLAGANRLAAAILLLESLDDETLMASFGVGNDYDGVAAALWQSAR